MPLTGKQSTKRLILGLLLILFVMALTACSSSSSEEDHEETKEVMEHEGSEHDEEEHEHEHEENERIPNEGASIRILEPQDDAIFAEGEDAPIEVEVDGFAIGEDGKHWHVYVDGMSWLMVVGGQTSDVLVGLEPGERIIEVYLTGGDHVELQDGDSRTIMIE